MCSAAENVSAGNKGKGPSESTSLLLLSMGLEKEWPCFYHYHITNDTSHYHLNNGHQTKISWRWDFLPVSNFGFSVENFCFFNFSAILSACFFWPCPLVQPTRIRMTRKAPPRLQRPSLILICHKDSHNRVIVTMHLSHNLSQKTVNILRKTVWPGSDLVCQPVTLTKGKSLLWLVAPVAGLASPDCTPGQKPVLLSRDLALWVTTCPWPGSHRATSWCRGHPCMVQREREGSD